MQRRLCATILLLETIVLGLTTPVLVSVNHVGTATALATGLGLAGACLVVAGLLRFRWAYLLGWAIQAAALALGVQIGAMVVLGMIFLALWATAYLMGAKIDRERSAWEAQAEAPPQRR
jgi:hypothetical protein